MKIGAYVPLFDGNESHIARTARQLEQAGLDGVFVFDGVRKSGKQAFPPLQALAVVAGATSTARAGTLVVRSGDERAQTVRDVLTVMYEKYGEHLIAGLGVGDAASFQAESRNVIPFAERVQTMTATAEHLRDLGAEVWLGGKSQQISDVAGAAGFCQNLWEPEPGEVANLVASGRSVSTAGTCEMDVAVMLQTLHTLHNEGSDGHIFLVKGSGEHTERAVDSLRAAVDRFRRSPN